MHNIVYLILRRMRRPLIVLIAAYALSVLGLTLIPGIDDQGRPWRMDFFHAFYFVSFMGSTIGFGEIPYPFTDAQRLWTTFSIYVTVIAWLYAIGSLLTIVQDQRFRRVVAFSAFSRKVLALREPFYLVCGHGDTGSLLVQELAERGITCTVVDNDEDRIHNLELADLPLFVPGLCADADEVETLKAAGLTHRCCQGVIAITDDDAVNLKIAITSKLLRPGLKVICRAESADTGANMASFGTDHIINPFDAFADSFAMAFKSPSMHLVYEWITAIHNAPLEDFVTPPAGKWVLCGYGRFGKALWQALRGEELPVQVIEADPGATRPPPETVTGRGTEAETLEQAGIHEAVGIIAGTDHDANNLSMLMTAKALNPALFTVARQNQRRNEAIFAASRPDLLMQAGTLTARRILSLIITPLLADFLELARRQDEDWANILVSRVTGVVTDRSPQTWAFSIDAQDTPAVVAEIEGGMAVSIRHLITDPHAPSNSLACVPLLLKRGSMKILVPDTTMQLEPGDQLLFCGNESVHADMQLTAINFNVLNYVITGEDRPAGHIWRWLAASRR
ncbi:NAD-binding protein [Thiohalobacter sp. IOR34]|uniref:potassium channel family protein n=1 Tax=Thiohalobacter sp. IOR34 TaxID=3057176 RepID=UPI0025B0A7AA|nr:NAD-binding protein [Thiohalobacter sp. IOR34]WJW74637.1 NAD-binding protein [Thiohalobacter sp. IOR34]